MSKTIYYLSSIDSKTFERTGGKVTIENPPAKTLPEGIDVGSVVELGFPGAVFSYYVVTNIEDVLSRKKNTEE